MPNQFVSLTEVLRGPIVDKNGQPSRELVKKLQEFDKKLLDTVTLQGQILGTIQGLIAAAARIEGRTEGIGTTVGKLTSVGTLSDADQIAADGTLFKRITGTQQTGATRASNALNANSQLVSSFKNNPLNTQAAYTGANPITAATGGSTNHATVSIASNTQQFGAGQVTYNSGSITPLNDSTLYYIYADDPTFAGGAVVYHATTVQSTLAASDARVYFGQVTTPAFGGGGTGGSGGGGGTCFQGATLIVTPDGPKRFDELPPLFMAKTLFGWRQAKVITSPYKGEMRYMGYGEFVTPGHRFKQGENWVRADEKWKTIVLFRGTVYNAEIQTDSDEERHYELANGEIAHNLSQL